MCPGPSAVHFSLAGLQSQRNQCCCVPVCVTPSAGTRGSLIFVMNQAPVFDDRTWQIQCLIVTHGYFTCRLWSWDCCKNEDLKSRKRDPLAESHFGIVCSCPVLSFRLQGLTRIVQQETRWVPKRCLVVAAVVLPTLFSHEGLVCFEVTTCTGCA